MKTRITLLAVFFTLFAAAQKNNENYLPAQYRATTCHSLFVKTQLTEKLTEQTVKEFLKKSITNLSDYRTGMRLNYINESPGGYHYSFTQTFNGVAIYQSEIKVNIDRRNVVHSLFDNSENTAGWNIDVSSANTGSVIALRKSTNKPVLCSRFVSKNGIETLLAAGEIIFERDTKSYSTRDTIAVGRIFNPDPLTTAQQFYGAPYYDHNDTTNSALNLELKTVNFHAAYNDTVFLLESPFVRVSDFAGPSFAPATSATGQFFFNRSQSGFEDVNAFYHISTMQNRIHYLGFGCADSLVEIDTHATEDDNSFFAPNYNPHRIYYGTGGVDDAEDADVCVHEYGHSVSETASPNSNSGAQRMALDEGLGDYLAGSYSRSLSPFHDNWMFNWDGHNEYWPGRLLDLTVAFDPSLTNVSIYYNGQIWSSTLMCINSAIGRDATDSLILQAHYSYASNMSMFDGGQLLLDADTLLTNGKYSCDIYRCLFAHALQPQNPLIHCTVGINNVEDFPVQFTATPGGFTLNQHTGAKMAIQIMTTTGALISRIDENQPDYTYSNSNLASGIYLVTVYLNGQEKTYKWCKLN